MKINIKATNLDLTPAFSQYIEEKIGSLSKFLKNYETEGEIQVQIEVARSTRHHHSGDVFRAEINLDLPGKMLRSVAEREDARLAINEARNNLQQEIKKHNQKSKIQNDKKSHREILKRKEQI
jgi:putative sigma-54 modulation protein